ncbi:hypothetical protein [Methylomonas sp. MgM2]
MVLSNGSTSSGNTQSDQAFVKAVVQGLMDVGKGRVMELAEAKAILSSDYPNSDTKQTQETLALLKMLVQSQQALAEGNTFSSEEAFSRLRERRDLA